MEDTGVRDRLAIERTALANERTMLAWLRLALGMLLAGLTFLKLFPEDAVYVGLSAGMLAFGGALLVFALVLYVVRRRRYHI